MLSVSYESYSTVHAVMFFHVVWIWMLIWIFSRWAFKLNETYIFVCSRSVVSLCTKTKTSVMQTDQKYVSSIWSYPCSSPSVFLIGIYSAYYTGVWYSAMSIAVRCSPPALNGVRQSCFQRSSRMFWWRSSRPACDVNHRLESSIYMETGGWSFYLHFWSEA